MKLPIKRPLLPVALLYTVGIVVADQFPAKARLALLLLALTMLLTLVIKKYRLVSFGSAIFLLALANHHLRTGILSPTDIRAVLGTEPHLATIRGNLLETPSLRASDQAPYPRWRASVRMRTTDVRWERERWRQANGVVIITGPGMLTNFFAGQVLEVTGVLAPPRAPMAEGLFDYRDWLRRQSIYYQLKTESEVDCRVLASPAHRPLADRFRSWGCRALARGLPSEDPSLRLEWALTLGWRPALTEEVCEPFVRAATYHIFAVDGLRMAIIFGIFLHILRVTGAPRAFCGIALLPIIWFYVALTGWPASAIRASIMLTIILVGWALKRPSDPINSLMAAALIILLWQPQQLYQAGFQLSFLVVLCLILTIPPLFDAFHRLLAPDPWLPAQLHPRYPRAVAVPARYIADLTITSFAAWIGSIPLVAYYFNIFTPISTPANVLAVPLCVLVLISNLLSLLLAAWFPPAAELFNHAGWFLMECIRISSSWFAHLPLSYWYLPPPSLFTTGLYYAILLFILTGRAFRPAFRQATLVALAVLSLVWLADQWRKTSTVRLTVLPAGGGSVVFSDASGQRRDLLIDVGPSNSVQFLVKPFLRAQGANHLPQLLLSHGDVHHTGGTEPVLELFGIRQVCVSPLPYRSTGYRRMLERLRVNSISLIPLTLNDTLAQWTVLHPDKDDRFSKADDGAIVLRGNLNGTRVLSLSDLGSEGQNRLLAREPDLRAEIAVAGLPASGEPLGEPLLRAIRPEVVIISDSEFPISERASASLRFRLEKTRIPILYTSETGAITIQLRKSRWTLQTVNGTLLTSAHQPASRR